MWDKATFPSNKGIFETKAQRLGTKYMLSVSLLSIRNKNDLPTASELVRCAMRLDPPPPPLLLPPHAELGTAQNIVTLIKAFSHDPMHESARF